MDKLDLLVFKEFANGKIQTDKLELDKRGFYKIGRFQMKQLQYISKKILAELKKKDKIINLMAEELADWYMDNRIDNRKIDKQYVINKFTNKAKESD